MISTLHGHWQPLHSSKRNEMLETVVTAILKVFWRNVHCRAMKTVDGVVLM